MQEVVEYGVQRNFAIPYNVQKVSNIVSTNKEPHRKPGLWGMISGSDDKIQAEPKFLYLPEAIRDGFIVSIGSGWQQKEDGKFHCDDIKWGVIDDNMNLVIPFEYDYIKTICDATLDGDSKSEKVTRVNYECIKYKNEKKSEYKNAKNEIIIPHGIYTSLGDKISRDQLVVYKEENGKIYAGIYDIDSQKEVLAPNKYQDLVIIDKNLYLIKSNFDQNYQNDEMDGTLIDEHENIIGKKKSWKYVRRQYTNKNYKFCGITKDDRYFLFNIVNGNIDYKEYEEEEFNKKFMRWERGLYGTINN